MKLTRYEQIALKPLLKALFQGPINKKQLSKEFFDNTNLIQLSDEHLHFENMSATDTIIVERIQTKQLWVDSASEDDVIQAIHLAKEKLENNARIYHLSDYLDEVLLLAIVKSRLRVGIRDNALLHYNGVSILPELSYNIKAILA